MANGSFVGSLAGLEVFERDLIPGGIAVVVGGRVFIPKEQGRGGQSVIEYLTREDLVVKKMNEALFRMVTDPPAFHMDHSGLGKPSGRAAGEAGDDD